ncbi:MAG: hypothetical protein J6I64_09290, partial [Lachnospiraceae bacterium]|nr:hypothetical protein [Lachnospiraceae bacterium]
KYMGRSMDPLQVAYDLEGMLLWGGHMGSNPLAVWWYLYRKGYHFRLAFTRRGMERLVRRSVREHRGRVAGVLAYIHRKGSHYTTFLREDSSTGPAEELRFLNAVYGVENHRLTVREFFQKYVKVPLCFVIVAR